MPSDLELCSLLPDTAVAAVTGGSVVLDPSSSQADSCLYTVTSALPDRPAYDLNFRIESDFENLEGAKVAFPAGVEVEVADQAYWAPDVNVLWFEKDDELYAIQLFQFAGDANEALVLAKALARAASESPPVP